MRQVPHLCGNDREAASLLPRTRRLDGRVQRKDIGLECDTVDHANDVSDFF